MNSKIFCLQLTCYLIDKQYGFKPRFSGVMNLLVINNFFLYAFESKCQADVIFTNLEETFGKVDHNILLQVLSKIGFGDPQLTWFEYLYSRYWLVKINGLLYLYIHNLKKISYCSKMFITYEAEVGKCWVNKIAMTT